jgi:hypothetical protein
MTGPSDRQYVALLIDPTTGEIEAYGPADEPDAIVLAAELQTALAGDARCARWVFWSCRYDRPPPAVLRHRTCRLPAERSPRIDCVTGLRDRFGLTRRCGRGMCPGRGRSVPVGGGLAVDAQTPGGMSTAGARPLTITTSAADPVGL